MASVTAAMGPMSAKACNHNDCESVGLALKERMKDMVMTKVEGISKKEELVQVAKKRYADVKAAVENEVKEGPKLDATIKNLESQLAEVSTVERVALESKVKEAEVLFEQGLNALASELDNGVMVKFIAALTIRSKEEATEPIGLSLPHGGSDADLAEAMIIAMGGPSTTDDDISVVKGAEESA